MGRYAEKSETVQLRPIIPHIF